MWKLTNHNTNIYGNLQVIKRVLYGRAHCFVHVLPWELKIILSLENLLPIKRTIYRNLVAIARS